MATYKWFLNKLMVAVFSNDEERLALKRESVSGYRAVIQMDTYPSGYGGVKSAFVEPKEGTRLDLVQSAYFCATEEHAQLMVDYEVESVRDSSQWVSRYNAFAHDSDQQSARLHAKSQLARQALLDRFNAITDWELSPATHEYLHHKLIGE